MEFAFGFCLSVFFGGAVGTNLPIPTPGAACTEQIAFNVQDTGIASFPHAVEVFGIPLLATQKFAQATEGGKNKLQHVASVLAELIDNDNDGCADDPNVLAKLLEPFDENGKKTFRLQDKVDDELSDKAGEDIFNAGYRDVMMVAEEETHPTCSGLDMSGECRDAAVEEALHLVNAHGHALAHKKVFGIKWKPRSKLTKAMDKARGKRIKKTPNKLSKYPKKAWFTYADATCTYDCQAIEYLWWGYAAYTGAGNGLASDPGYNKEFHVLKQTDFKAKDKKLKKIFDKSKSGSASYRIATNIVDGIYTGCPVCSGGTSHGGSVPAG